MESLWAPLVLVWFGLWTLVGGMVGWSKGRTLDGAVLGFFLSFIGVIIMAVQQPTPRKLDVLEHQREEAEAHALKDVLGFDDATASRRRSGT